MHVSMYVCVYVVKKKNSYLNISHFREVSKISKEAKCIEQAP